MWSLTSLMSPTFNLTTTAENLINHETEWPAVSCEKNIKELISIALRKVLLYLILIMCGFDI